MERNQKEEERQKKGKGNNIGVMKPTRRKENL